MLHWTCKESLQSRRAVLRTLLLAGGGEFRAVYRRDCDSASLALDDDSPIGHPLEPHENQVIHNHLCVGLETCRKCSISSSSAKTAARAEERLHDVKQIFSTLSGHLQAQGVCSPTTWKKRPGH